MASGDLAVHLKAERATAIQHLLQAPLINSENDAYIAIVRQRVWLTDWFAKNCGWSLSVDTNAGFARLVKRRVALDPTRPLRRSRGGRDPFDRRRYQLLCLIAAELLTTSVMTVGRLAVALGEVGFDPQLRTERQAFVDAILTLRVWQALKISGIGGLEAYADDPDTNAVLSAEPSRLHRLLDPTVSPSAFESSVRFDEALKRLVADPRYDLETAADDQNEAIRVTILRRLIDDPVLYFASCNEAEQAYVSTSSGRSWLRDRIEDAGLILEERAEGLLAIDPSRVTTDMVFPASAGSVHHLALLLIDELVALEPSGSDHPEASKTRVCRSRSFEELVAATSQRLADNPNWAKGYQGGTQEAARFCSDAVELLIAFGLAERCDDAVRALPAMCRYQAEPPAGPETDHSNKLF